MKLPPPTVLDVCLRRARLGVHKGDFLKLHAALVAALTALQSPSLLPAAAAAATTTTATTTTTTEIAVTTDDVVDPVVVEQDSSLSTATTAAATATADTAPPPATSSSSSSLPPTELTATSSSLPPQPLQTSGAGILASALLLHRTIVMLVPIHVSSTSSSTTTTTTAQSSDTANPTTNSQTSNVNSNSTSSATRPGTTTTTTTPSTLSPVPTTAAAATLTAIATTHVTATPILGQAAPARPSSLSSILEPPIVTDVIAAVQIAERQAPVIVDWTIYKSLYVVLQCLSSSTTSEPSALALWLETKFPCFLSSSQHHTNHTPQLTVAAVVRELTHMYDHVQRAHQLCRDYTQLFAPVAAAVKVNQVHMEQADASILGCATMTTTPHAAPSRQRSNTAVVPPPPPRTLLGSGPVTTTTAAVRPAKTDAWVGGTITHSAAQQRNHRIQVIYRLKDVAWKLALSDYLQRQGTREETMTTLSPLQGVGVVVDTDAVDSNVSTTAHHSTPSVAWHNLDRRVAIRSFAAALGCVVTLSGHEPWKKPLPEHTNGTSYGKGTGNTSSNDGNGKRDGMANDIDAELLEIPLKKKIKMENKAVDAASTDAMDETTDSPADVVVRAILVEANQLLQDGWCDTDAAETTQIMTEEQLRTEMIRFAHIVKTATDEQRMSLAPLMIRLAPTNKITAGRVVGKSGGKSSTKPSVRVLTVLQVLLGVATCEKLTWYLPTFATVLYRRALATAYPTLPVVAPPPHLTDGTTTAAYRGTSSRRYCPWFVDFAVLLVGETAAYLGTAPTPSLADACAAALDPVAIAAAADAVARTTIPRSVTPVIISEAMELNEWAVSVTFLELVKPSFKLRRLLDDLSAVSDCGNYTGVKKWHGVVLGIVNKALLRLSQEHVAERPPRKSPVSVSLALTTLGCVQVHGDLTPDKQLCKAVVAFYYHALEAVLYMEKLRLSRAEETQATTPERASQSKLKSSHLVLNEVFHGALLTCCCSCVTKAIGFTQKLNPSHLISRLQIYSILHVTGISPFEFLKVVETFLDALGAESPARNCLGSPLIFGLPRMLQKDIRQVEVNTMDSLVWARNSTISSDSITDKILEFQEKMANKQNDDICLWPPLELAPTLQEELEESGVHEFVLPDYPELDHEDYSSFRSVAFVLRKLLFLVHKRITTLCDFLQISDDVPVVLHVWKTFRYLMRHHIDLLFDRHVDHWVLCCIYAVCRAITYEPEVKFGKIIEAYVAYREPDLGSVTCQRIVRHIKLAPGITTEEGMGNVITLYNKVFVPAMKDYLLNNQSLKACADKMANIRAVADTTVRPVEPTPGVLVRMGGTTVTPFDAPPASAVVTFGKFNEEAVAVANTFAKDNKAQAMVVD